SVFSPPAVYTNDFLIVSADVTFARGSGQVPATYVAAVEPIIVDLGGHLTTKIPLSVVGVNMGGQAGPNYTNELDVVGTSLTLNPSGTASPKLNLAIVGSLVGILHATGGARVELKGSSGVVMDDGASGSGIVIDGAGSKLLVDGAASSVVVGDN